jgi:hypothetical protein
MQSAEGQTMSADKFPFLRDLDASKPDEVLADGRKVFSVRCHHPFSAPMDAFDVVVRSQEERVVIDSGEGLKLDPSVEDEAEKEGDAVDFENPVIMGTASSTSVDFYGTEMSKDALEQMAMQMRKGIPYLPRHNNGFSGALEWDEVIGRTVEASVERVDTVRAAHSPAEEQYVLRTKVMLYKDEPKAQAMIRRLAREERIGQSIGGWFTQLQFVQNSEQEIERVIVLGIELDHLAATRAPANPDSNDIVSMRAAVRSVLHQLPEPMKVERAAPDYSEFPLAPEDTSWSWEAADQDAVLGEEMDWDRYASVHAYYDPEQREVKQGYKLPFAKVIDGRIHVVWRGVAAVMGILLGARGGVDISDEDRRRAYDLMVRYYERFEKQPPEFRAVGDVEARHIVEIEDEGEYVWVKFKKEAPEEESAEEMPMQDDPTEEVAVEDSVRSGEEVAVEATRTATVANESRAIAGETKVERKMSDINIDTLAALLDSKLAPLAERVAQLEVGKTAKTETVEDRLVAAEARAKLAEEQVRSLLNAPHRVGRTAVGQVDGGAVGTHGLKGIVEATRSKTPMMAQVAERMAPALTVKAAKAGEHGDLRAALSDLINVAVAEGVMSTTENVAKWA